MRGLGMDDLEHQLARIGYRGNRREPECWRVVPVGPSMPIPGGVASSRRRRNRGPILRLWLDRLSDPELPSPYRICRDDLG